MRDRGGPYEKGVHVCEVIERRQYKGSPEETSGTNFIVGEGAVRGREMRQNKKKYRKKL